MPQQGLKDVCCERCVDVVKAHSHLPQGVEETCPHKLHWVLVCRLVIWTGPKWQGCIP